MSDFRRDRRPSCARWTEKIGSRKAAFFSRPKGAGILSQRGSAASLFSTPCGSESKGPFSFAKENGPFGTPRERLRLAVQSLNDLCASGMQLPACGVAALALLHVNAASASNAAFRTQSAAEVTSLAPHDSKARLQPVTNSRRFMAKPCTPHLIPQAEQIFKIETANVRGQGARPLAFSWGCKGAILSRERMAPFISCSTRGAAFLFLPHCAGVRIKGDILFLEREYPPYTPKRKDEGPSPSTPHIGSLRLE